MKVGDLVRRKPHTMADTNAIGIVIPTSAWHHPNDTAVMVIWPDGDVSVPFTKNLELVSESR